ncbi:MAG: hypothetical protein PUA56_01210 [Bacillales bacterium]|nr:hypothetical protein [Bacillales bacterium]
MINYKIVIQDQVFTSLIEFGRNMYLYPEACESLIVSNKFLKLLSKIDRKKFDQLIKINHEVRDINAFLFHAQYVFCPHMELKHHGYSFKSLKELGDKILSYGPTVDIYLKDFLKFHLLSKYMVDQGLNEQKPNVYQRVLELEIMFKENENKAYFLLGFLLAECDTIIYMKKPYDDVEEFFKDMISNYHIINFASNLDNNQYVYAWLEVKGYGQKVLKYQSLIETIESMEVKL